MQEEICGSPIAEQHCQYQFHAINSLVAKYGSMGRSLYKVHPENFIYFLQSH